MKDRIATILGIPLSVLKADIADISWTWEILVEDNRADKKQAVRSLRGLVRSYIRGRGCRMGNYQGFMKHRLTYAYLCTEVVRYVIDEGEILLPHLHTLGFNSLESALNILRDEISQPDIMEQAEQILKEHRGPDITK
jgi:hypothetical protein